MGDYLQVTADGAASRETGAWTTTSYNFQAMTWIQVRFTVQFSGAGTLGDGVAFVFQPTTATNVLGYLGNFLGYAHDSGYTQCRHVTSPSGFAVGLSPYADELRWGSGGPWGSHDAVTMNAGGYRVTLTLTRPTTSDTTWTYQVSRGGGHLSGTVTWSPPTATFLGFTGGTGGATMTSTITSLVLRAY